MIETTQILQASDGVLVPKGVRLDFKNGKAKYQNHPIERKLIPLQAIKGAAGPFLNACCAVLLNDNRGFQEQFKKRYQDWAHFVLSGDNIIVYVWDTREVIDVIPGLHAGVKGGPITRTLVNKETGERKEQVLGHRKHGWSKSIYDMVTWPQYHRPDNGMPLVTNNPEWKQVVDDFNKANAKFAYEAFISPEERQELAEIGSAMPDGSYPIRNEEDLKNAIQAYGRAKDKDAAKQHIIERAIDLGLTELLPEQWFEPSTEATVGPNGRACSVFRYTPGFESILRRAKLDHVKSEPWLHIGVSSWNKPCYAIWIWDTRKVLASGIVDKSFVMEILRAGNALREYAVDNAQRLNGSGQAVDIINKSMTGVQTPVFSRESAEYALRIAPAKGEPNKHEVWLDDSIVAYINAKQLEQTQTHYDSSEDEELLDDVFPVQGKVYKNTDDNKLIVTDANGEIIELPCLQEQIVPERLILDELSGHIAATENLSDDLFDSYEYVTGSPSGIKVLYINDLYELCQLIAAKSSLPNVTFEDTVYNTKEVIVANDSVHLHINFTAMTYSVSGELADICKVFISKHFSQKLRQFTKPMSAQEAFLCLR